MDPEQEAVVVPLIPLDAEPNTEMMLRMLLNREALILTRPTHSTTAAPSGMVAQTAGAFAKAVGQATSQFASRAPASADLFRVVLPTGSVMKDLVPAIGGGFRGMVRTGGAATFTGHVRLLPAVAGAGATVAAGPLIATVGLAIAGEMLAQHQMNKKLNAINYAVKGIQRRLDEDERAVLTTARKEAGKVAGYLLDQARLPALAHAGAVFGDLAQLTNKQVERLDRWSDVVNKHGDSDHVNGSQLMTDLMGKHENPVEEFERSVAQTYESLALSARVVVLEKVATELANPDRSLPHVEHVLRNELSELAARQAQLTGVLDDLNALQVDAGWVPNPVVANRILGARAGVGRMARALHTVADALPVLTDQDQTVIELKPTDAGLSVLAPAAA